MLKKFYKWFNKATMEATRVEVTKDYFSEDDEFYGDPENGWEKLPDHTIEIYIEEKKDVKDS